MSTVVSRLKSVQSIFFFPFCFLLVVRFSFVCFCKRSQRSQEKKAKEVCNIAKTSRTFCFQLCHKMAEQHHFCQRQLIFTSPVTANTENKIIRRNKKFPLCMLIGFARHISLKSREIPKITSERSKIQLISLLTGFKRICLKLLFLKKTAFMMAEKKGFRKMKMCAILSNHEEPYYK